MCAGAVYLPWLAAVAPRVLERGHSASFLALFPMGIATVRVGALVWEPLGWVTGVLGTVMLVWIARILLEESTAGFFAYIGTLAAISLWLGRMMAM